MSWAKRLKRVFGGEIEGCARCGGKLRIIASIEESAVIARILALFARPYCFVSWWEVDHHGTVSPC